MKHRIPKKAWFGKGKSEDQNRKSPPVRQMNIFLSLANGSDREAKWGWNSPELTLENWFVSELVHGMFPCEFCFGVAMPQIHILIALKCKSLLESLPRFPREDSG